MIVTESIELETPRLTLGQWRDEDLPVFAELNADPEIMRYFPSCLSREDSDAMAARCKALIADNGWGFWAVRLRDSGLSGSLLRKMTPSLDPKQGKMKNKIWLFLVFPGVFGRPPPPPRFLGRI